MSYENELDKNLYEGDDVICEWFLNHKEIGGYSSAICRCSHILHIKTPRRKDWYSIKCPKCGFVVNLYCGEEGEKLSTDDIRSIIPIYGVLGD